MTGRAHPTSVAVWSSVVFASIGCACSVIGPTLLDLAERLSVANDVISLIFPVRAVGAFIGTATSGFLFDRFQKCSYMVMVVSILMAVTAVSLIPLSVHIAMLGVVMFFFGFFLQGFVVNGAQSVLLKACQKLKRLPSYVMFLHFSYAVGATIAPLWAGLLVSKDSPMNFNASYQLDVNATSFPGNSSTEKNTTGDGVMTEPSLLFGWAYWLCAPIFLTGLAAFLYYSIRYELSGCNRTRGYERIADGPELCLQQMSTTAPTTYFLTSQPRVFKVVFFTLVSLLTYFSIALEACFTNYLFSYAVHSGLFSKKSAATLNSVFWASYATFRLLAVFLSLLKVPSPALIMFNLAGGLLTSLGVAIFPEEPITMWCGAAVLGACMSSTFPSIVAWLSQQTEVSGKTSALLLCSSTLADMTVPITIATLMTRTTPLAFLYFTVADYGIAITLAVTLFSFTLVRKSRCLKVEPGSAIETGGGASPPSPPSPSTSSEELLLSNSVTMLGKNYMSTEATGHVNI